MFEKPDLNTIHKYLILNIGHIALDVKHCEILH
jgi:hypothetical protein